MAWSPYKDRIISYVENNQGCSKWDIASLCTTSRLRNPSKQYYIVNTALRNGWIEGYFSAGRWHLYTPEAFMLIEDPS
jgi:hypothetical protein